MRVCVCVSFMQSGGRYSGRCGWDREEREEGEESVTGEEETRLAHPRGPSEAREPYMILSRHMQRHVWWQGRREAGRLVELPAWKRKKRATSDSASPSACPAFSTLGWLVILRWAALLWLPSLLGSTAVASLTTLQKAPSSTEM